MFTTPLTHEEHHELIHRREQEAMKLARARRGPDAHGPTREDRADADAIVKAGFTLVVKPAAEEVRRTNVVLREIADERTDQRKKWGNDHDDRESSGTRNQPWHLILKIDKRLIALPLETPDLRGMFVEVAALAVAAIETLDRLEQ